MKTASPMRNGTWCHEAYVCIGALSTDIRPLYSVHLPPAGARGSFRCAGWAGTGDGLRPGVTGEAKIVVRHSNVFGAMLWAVRKRVRGDLFL